MFDLFGISADAVRVDLSGTDVIEKSKERYYEGYLSWQL